MELGTRGGHQPQNITRGCSSFPLPPTIQERTWVALIAAVVAVASDGGYEDCGPEETEPTGGNLEPIVANVAAVVGGVVSTLLAMSGTSM